MNGHELKEKIIFLTKESIVDAQIGHEKFACCLKQLLHEAKSDGVSRKEAYHAIYSTWLDLRNDIPEEIGDTLLDFLDVITFWVHPSCYIWPKDEGN